MLVSPRGFPSCLSLNPGKHDKSRLCTALGRLSMFRDGPPPVFLHHRLLVLVARLPVTRHMSGTLGVGDASHQCVRTSNRARSISFSMT